ncbi:MAG: DUF4421 family protein [Bacteroidales bacterium]|nr:DUF4421 family protein [Bacteroidales bacterium]
MKKLLLTIISLFVCMVAMSQEIQLDGNFLSRRYNRITYDTDYIMRPNCKWTFKLRTMTLMQTFHTKGEFEGTRFESNLSTGLKPKLNVQVGYMGIALAGGISFNKLKGGQDRDFDIKLNMYGKKFGFEFGLSGIESLHGNYIFDIPGMPSISSDDGSIVIPLPLEFEVPEGKVSQAVFNFNFYYAFNNKKFSYPAAFTQMFIQKKSAGSLLVGGELHVNVINIGDTIDNDELFRLTNVTYGLGVGYGYNLVLPHRWLIHASVLPYLVLHSRTTVRNYMQGDGHSVTADFPEVFIIGKAAIVHDFNARWFAGATGQLNWSNVNSKKLKTGNSQYQVFLFVGIRL